MQRSFYLLLNSIVLENDEMCYNVDDLLPVCEELDIPLVFGRCWSGCL